MNNKLTKSLAQLERRREQLRQSQRRFRLRVKEKKEKALNEKIKKALESEKASPETTVIVDVEATQQLERRREARRRNQQNYRNRQKQLNQRAYEKNQAMNEENNRLRSYQELMTQGGLVCHTNRVGFHGLIAALYQDYFNTGIEVQATPTKRREIQESFVYFNFDANVMFESNQTGPAYFIKQAELYATLFQPHMKNPRVSKMDMEGNVFQLTTALDFTLRHNTISALYPHMLADAEFMEKVVGKQISFQLHQIFHFGENNKVECFRPIYNMATGWCKLLKDPSLVAKVLRDQKLNGSFIEEDAVLQQRRNKYLAIEAIMNSPVN